MSRNSERKTYKSDICLDGKRLRAMREIAEAAFGESFMFIEVREGRFLVRVEDAIDLNAYYRFTGRYPLCRVRIYSERDISELKPQKTT